MKKLIVVLSLIISMQIFAGEKIHSAYLIGEFQNLESVKSKLKGVGLEFLGSANVNQSKEHEVVFYSNTQLEESAKKSNRGFAGAMRILVNSSKKTLVIANPQYFLRAFLQKDFDNKLSENIEKKLVKAFGNLKENDDQLEEDELADYHFMMAMPYYEDFLTVGEGKQSDLIKKLEDRAKKNIVFKKKIGDKFLYAITLSSKIERFVYKLDVTDKGVLLPYMVVIDKNEAKIMHAKFYLALSLPKLSLGQFMTISNIPGEIEDSFEALFE